LLAASFVILASFRCAMDDGGFRSSPTICRQI
jgi:hypothetical protein